MIIDKFKKKKWYIIFDRKCMYTLYYNALVIKNIPVLILLIKMKPFFNHYRLTDLFYESIINRYFWCILLTSSCELISTETQRRYKWIKIVFRTRYIV